MSTSTTGMSGPKKPSRCPMTAGMSMRVRLLNWANVTGFRIGDIVSGEGHVVCGRCRNCLAGRLHLPEYAKGWGESGRRFAEYVAFRPPTCSDLSSISPRDCSVFSILTAMRFIPPCPSIWWARTSSLPVPGPLASWRPWSRGTVARAM